MKSGKCIKCSQKTLLLAKVSTEAESVLGLHFLLWEMVIA